MKTKVINLYAGPGCGKSTIASELFALMKWKGMSVELVSEYAKDVVWAGHTNMLADQLWVSANQNSRQRKLVGKVEYIITDSPLLLCAVYAKDYPHLATFLPFLQSINDEYHNLNFQINRNKPYVSVGRMQDEQSARDIDEQIGLMLNGGMRPLVGVQKIHGVFDGVAGVSEKILAKVIEYVEG